MDEAQLDENQELTQTCSPQGCVWPLCGLLTKPSKEAGLWAAEQGAVGSPVASGESLQRAATLRYIIYKYLMSGN